MEHVLHLLEQIVQNKVSKEKKNPCRHLHSGGKDMLGRIQEMHYD